MSWPWSQLGLPGPTDLSEVRHAYAEKLKTTHPEEDPEGFQRLHSAYQLASRMARQQKRREGVTPPEPQIERPAPPPGERQKFNFDELLANGPAVPGRMMRSRTLTMMNCFRRGANSPAAPGRMMRSRTLIMMNCSGRRANSPISTRRKRRNRTSTLTASSPRVRRNGRRPAAAGRRSAGVPRLSPRRGHGSARRRRIGPKSGSSGSARNSGAPMTGSAGTSTASRRTDGRIPRPSSTPLR